MARAFEIEKVNEVETKYHIGDKFKYGRFIGVITNINSYGDYSLTYIDAKTHDEVSVNGLKNAWFADKDLDDFSATAKEYLKLI